MLQDCCTAFMIQERKNNIWGVLVFACRFQLARMQGSCLHSLQQTDRGHKLVWVADKIVQVMCDPDISKMHLLMCPESVGKTSGIYVLLTVGVDGVSAAVAST